MSEDKKEKASEPTNRLSIAETLLYSCMKLMPAIGQDPMGTSGTGFFFTFSIDEKGPVPTILTNKHVLANANGTFADFHLAKNELPSDSTDRYLISFENCPVILHPDEKIDLAAILIGPILEQAHKKEPGIYYPGLAESNIPSNWDQFDALEELTMVGCPRGIIDEHNKLPIFRKGHSASHIAKDYNGQKEFLIDMACFPGSSGSPVFVFNPTGYRDPRSNGIVMGSRFYLVGILYSGPLIQNDGHIVLNQAPRVEVNSMMHLGQVIRATEVDGIKREISKLLEKLQ